MNLQQIINRSAILYWVLFQTEQFLLLIKSKVMRSSVSDYQSMGQISQVEMQANPVRQKLTRSHLKLVSKSSEKTITQKVQPKNFSNTSRFQSSIPANSKQSTPRKGLKIEIDSRLNRVYSNVVKYKSISLKPVVLDTSNRIQTGRFPAPFDTKPSDNSGPIAINEELPYELLKSYIQSIYEDYQIKDPLQELGKDFQFRMDPQFKIQSASISRVDQKTERYKPVLLTPPKHPVPSSKIVYQQKDKLSTKKKILQLKRHFINEMSMTENTTQKKTPLKLTTAKKINLQTEYYENPQYNNINTIRTPVLENKFINASTYGNPKLAETKFTMASASQQKGYFRNCQSINMRTSQANDYDFTAGTSRVEQQKHTFGTQNQPLEKKNISQTFRYCFVCQSSVLQANIAFHESQCSGLKELLNDPHLHQRMLPLIQSKVDKIKSQLESAFRQISQQNLNDQFALLQDQTDKWMAAIENHKVDTYQSRNEIFPSEKDLTSLIQKTSVLKTIELINKLKWFVHLKNNFVTVSEK